LLRPLLSVVSARPLLLEIERGRSAIIVLLVSFVANLISAVPVGSCPVDRYGPSELVIKS
jgi:hypothetical protein